MSDLMVLRAEATAAAQRRGHAVIEWYQPWHGEARSIQNGACRECGAEVQVMTKPAPNEIAIGGEAVALDCE